MAQARIRVTDFSSGEWSPTLNGRVDLDRYPRACRILENFILLQGGGAQRRPGTRHDGIASSRPRLVPFEFAAGIAYVLEFTQFQIRVYGDDGLIEISPGVPLTITTPYRTGDLPALDVSAQSADVLFLTHPNWPPARLERLAADGSRWRYVAQVLTPPPSIEIGTRPAATGSVLTPAAVSGTAVAVTSAPGLFLASDIGRTLRVLAGVSIGAEGKILAVGTTSTPTQATVTISVPFTSTAPIAAADWLLTDRRVPEAGATLGVFVPPPDPPPDGGGGE